MGNGTKHSENNSSIDIVAVSLFENMIGKMRNTYQYQRVSMARISGLGFKRSLREVVKNKLASYARRLQSKTMNRWLTH